LVDLLCSNFYGATRWTTNYTSCSTRWALVTMATNQATETTFAPAPAALNAMKKQYDPLKVEKTDHPDLVGGVVWADCELDWIRAYGTRCYNHGNAKGMEAGRLLFEEPKVGAGGTAVTREMIGAAHDIMLKRGDFVLSAVLLEKIYLAMEAKKP